MIKYRAFIKVVELGSITKAAKELGYSQPGVSHMLDSLEEEVGFPLLIRSRDLIRPTEDGKKILYYCREIVKSEDSLKETADSVKGLLSGNIRIGTLNSMLVDFLPRVLSDFSKEYPGISIRVEEHSAADLRKLLVNGSIDIAFTNSDVPGSFEFLPLFRDTVCIAMTQDHPLAKYDKIPAAELDGCDYIMPMPGWDDLFIVSYESMPFKPNVTHFVASDTAGIAMAKSKLGVYPLSSLQTGIMSDELVCRQFEGSAGRNLGIVIKNYMTTTPALKEFVKKAQDSAEKFTEGKDALQYIGTPADEIKTKR